MRSKHPNQTVELVLTKTANDKITYATNAKQQAPKLTNDEH